MSKYKIDNIDHLKKQLINLGILGINEFAGCSESEILRIEEKYGKLPISYRQIISLIGHSFDFMTTDLALIIGVDDCMEQLLIINEEFLDEMDEVTKNGAEDETDEKFLTIPKNIFIIDSHYGVIDLILTDKDRNREDSPVYRFAQDIEEIDSSVWDWIDKVVKNSRYKYTF